MNRNLETALAIIAPLPYLVGRAAVELYNGVSEMVEKRNEELAAEAAATELKPPTAAAA